MKREKPFHTSKIAALAAAVILAGAVPAVQNRAYAQESMHLDTIRVALFMSSAKFNSQEPVVTMSSAAGLEVGVQEEGAVHTWVTVPGTAVVRASLDQYNVKMLESTDFSAASALNAKLQSMKLDSYILSRSKQGKIVFQLYLGGYPTPQEAESAKLQALKDPVVAAAAQAAAPDLTGPCILQRGSIQRRPLRSRKRPCMLLPVSQRILRCRRMQQASFNTASGWEARQRWNS
ncbi:SPOR domain-containing protein [Paenibacillus hexagrammi]|uniref:SPOR domain-containing protein n=1 Tax=Paenibacillus hexagrammi TaxID=2908839 RepID=A0ABY3SGB3_9BACL|nr:hypothetical protein [Paenibacillus sp. YPD9-1]UJF31977.1 hypothetical protein L0M14_19815 [Paenibacillus sp. YPD9-1]